MDKLSLMLRICQPYLFTQRSMWRGVALFYNKAIINVTLEACAIYKCHQTKVSKYQFFLPHTSLLNLVIAQWGKSNAEWRQRLNHRSNSECTVYRAIICTTPPGDGTLYHLFPWRPLLNGLYYRNLMERRIVIVYPSNPQLIYRKHELWWKESNEQFVP